MHKRTFTRAAGVSPPWVRLALATASVLSEAERRCAAGVGHHSAKIGPVMKSGGREPAVGIGEVRNVACHKAGAQFRARTVCHGGLTPPALGCTCGRYCRCAIPYTGTLSLPRGADAGRSWCTGCVALWAWQFRPVAGREHANRAGIPAGRRLRFARGRFGRVVSQEETSRKASLFFHQR
jgi:hypothetical protein